MALLVDSFEGFGDAHHDAFRPEKWRSNQFNLERRRVREALELVGEAILPRLTDAGVDLAPVVTSDTPTLSNGHHVRDMALHFLRGADARNAMGGIVDKGRGLASAVLDPAPWSKHLTLSVVVSLRGVEVGLIAPHGAWPDRDNGVAAFQDPAAADQLRGAVAALGEGWRLGEDPTRGVRRWTRGHAELADASFVGRAAEVLVAVAAVYRVVAWSEANDRIDLIRRISDEAEGARSRAAQAEEAQRALRQARAQRAAEASKRADAAQSAKAAAEAAFRRLAGPPRSKDLVVTPAPKAQPPPTGGRPTPRRGGAKRKEGPKRPEVRQWVVGTDVVLGKGLLAGKKGVVKSQSGYTVTVAVGGLEVRMESRDLTPA